MNEIVDSVLCKVGGVSMFVGIRECDGSTGTYLIIVGQERVDGDPATAYGPESLPGEGDQSAFASFYRKLVGSSDTIGLNKYTENQSPADLAFTCVQPPDFVLRTLSDQGLEVKVTRILFVRGISEAVSLGKIFGPWIDGETENEVALDMPFIMLRVALSVDGSRLQEARGLQRKLVLYQSLTLAGLITILSLVCILVMACKK